MLKKKNLIFTISVILVLSVSMLFSGCMGGGASGGNTPDGNKPGGNTPGGNVEDTYTITFETNGGSAVNPLIQEENTVLMYPDNPVKTGHSFVGWFLDEDFTRENALVTMPKQNLTLYAKWQINEYTITFDTDGGTEIAPVTQVFDTDVTAPENPTRDGYDFAGWFSDKEFTTEYAFSKMPGENITVYAKWDEKTYNIYYKLDEGVNDPENLSAEGVNNPENPSTYVEADGMITLKDPTKKYHVFMGWYTDMDCTEKITQIDSSRVSDIDVYAKWLCYLKFDYDSNYDKVVTFNSEANGLVDHVEIPDRYGRIGAGGFSHCKMKSITIPASVCTIKRNAFYDCPNLERINVASLYDWTSIDFVTKESNPLYKGRDDKAEKVLYVNDEPITELTFTDDIFSIRKYNFCGYNALTKVTFSDKISYADEYAFAGCKNLKTIAMDENAGIGFGKSCFERCSALTDIAFSKVNKTIGNYVFNECTSLEKIVIPNNVTSIGEFAFEGCEKLSDVTFSENLTSIYNAAFRGCNLKDIVLPSKITMIGASAFSSCKLTNIVLPAGLKTIEDNAFAYNYFTSVVIPESVTSVGECIFNRNSTTGGDLDDKIKILCEAQNDQTQGWSKQWNGYKDPYDPYPERYHYYYGVTWGYKAPQT